MAKRSLLQRLVVAPNQNSEETTEQFNKTSSTFIENASVSKRQRLCLSISSTSSQHQPICEPIGTEYKVGKETLLSEKTLYKTEMTDYTILTDAPFDSTFAPKEIKPLLKKKWIFKLHVNQTLSPLITRPVLRDRVEGGQILAYRYTECSVAGNQCVYYGFIPTIEKTFKDAHKTCYISSMDVWPRTLYVYLQQSYACTCSDGCNSWKSRMSDSKTFSSFCKKKIKWDQIYIMMGGYDKDCHDYIKDFRSCSVCAQCFDCSKSVKYCRKHKQCKHKTAKPLEEVKEIVNSSIKQCKLYQ